MKRVKISNSAGKFRIFCRNCQGIFKYFGIFGYKNIQNRKYLHIFPTTIAVCHIPIFVNICRYAHIPTYLIIFIYSNTQRYIYIRVYKDLHIHIPQYRNTQEQGYGDMQIFRYRSIQVYKQTDINVFPIFAP